MKKDSVYIKRLLKLASYLKTVPEERFDFSHWVGDDWQGKPDLSCGTTACALGHATTVPSFRKAGLMMVKVGGYSDGIWNRDTITLKHNRNADAIEAGMEVFGLDYDECCYLFTPRSVLRKEDCTYLTKNRYSLGAKATANQVAVLIEDFVELKYFARKRALAKLAKAKLTTHEKNLLGLTLVY